jgi:hypothetical protein
VERSGRRLEGRESVDEMLCSTVATLGSSQRARLGLHTFVTRHREDWYVTAI